MEKEKSTNRTKRRKKLVLLITAVVVLIGMGFFVVYFSVRSEIPFLNSLRKYEHSREELRNRWVHLTARAKTPSHYLMLLKRLDTFSLYKEYHRTLIRALWRYPTINSIVALGVEYFLSLSLNEIPREHYVEREFFALQKAVEGSVERLWDEYPEMVRLYYAIRFREGDVSVAVSRAFEEDEILSFYKKIQNDEAKWQDFRDMWQITKDIGFLYYAVVLAKEAGEEKSAQEMYSELPVEFLFAVPRRALSMALLFRDFAVLELYAENYPTQEVTLALASLYTMEGEFRRALHLMQLYEKEHRNDTFAKDWSTLMMWLATHDTKEKDADSWYAEEKDEVKDIYQKVKKRHPEESDIDYEYFVYLYMKNPIKVSEEDNEELVSVFGEEFLKDPRVQFLRKITVMPDISSRQRAVQLWKILDETKGDLLWKKIAANYFILLDLEEEEDLFFSQHTDNVLLPYVFLRNAKASNETEMKRVVEETKNTKYPWWFAYNVAVYHFFRENYREAKKEIDHAERDYGVIRHTIIDQNTIEWKAYLWAQQALLAVYHTKEYEKAQEYVQKIKDTLPAFVHLSELERTLNNAIQENTVE